MKEKILPSVVLALICAICSGFLIYVHDLTYVDTTGQITDELKAALVEIYGTSDGYEMKKNSDGTVFCGDDFDSVIYNANGTCAFEITADGYSSDGLYLLVGIDETGTVKGISVMTISDTPGVGTKVTDKGYLNNYVSLNDSSEVDNIDNVSGATYSSKGIKRAVKSALDAYNANKEVIFNE